VSGVSGAVSGAATAMGGRTGVTSTA
jgi:hypothetical protein